MKKGFTLIELLAVIVILAVIALIAVPIVLNIIEKSRRGAVKSSAANYIKAVETAIISAELDPSGDVINVGVHNVSDFDSKIELKGTKPKEGKFIIGSSKSVTLAELTYDEYVVRYDANSDNYTVVNKEDAGESIIPNE